MLVFRFGMDYECALMFVLVLLTVVGRNKQELT
jgi:hypothetical protein